MRFKNTRILMHRRFITRFQKRKTTREVPVVNAAFIYIHLLSGERLVVSACLCLQKYHVCLCVAVRLAERKFFLLKFSLLFSLGTKHLWQWLAHRLLVWDCQLLSTFIPLNVLNSLLSELFLISSVVCHL